jgi:hypothetical protein
MISVGVAPAALYLLIPRLGKASRFAWLAARPQPGAVLGSTGIELNLPGIGTRSFRWDEVGSMSMEHRLQSFGELRDADGQTLVTIPESLIYPRGPHWWDDGDTLAQAVVNTRPDRYELTGPKSLVGRPGEFDLIGRRTALDVPAWRRRQHLFLGVLLLISMLVIWFTLAAPTLLDR